MDKITDKSAIKHGLTPTPPLPEDLPGIDLTDNARQVLIRRYVRRGDDGEPAETVDEMFWRVAYHIAVVEESWGGDVLSRAREFYLLLTGKRFFPNSPTFTGAGTPLGQLAACFVLPITDDMGRDAAGIFTTLRNAALIQQTGGGNGFSFSRLRPKGALVKSSAGQATGPVGFLRVYDNAFGEIAQGGSRRGANMGVLRVDHPDVEEFITCKTDENAITNFNISVGITDDFMRAVEADEDWDLVFPDVASSGNRKFSGTIEQARAAGIPLRTHKTVRARDLFNKIVRQAHHNGEPGMLFLDAANRSNPVPHLYALESTNPCFIGSTRIATHRGLLPIQTLAEQGIQFMAATDDRALGAHSQKSLPHGIAFRPASLAWKTRQNVPVFRLVTRHGYEVTATADHRFLTTNRGYVPLSELQAGDQLLIQSQEGAWSTTYALPDREAIEEKMAVMSHGSGRLATGHDQSAGLPAGWSHDLGLVMGMLVGGGWLSDSNGSPVGLVFAKHDAATLEAARTPLQEWFGAGHLHARESAWELTYGRLPYEFFKSLGLQETPAPEKRVPDSIWQAPREAVVGFLQGLFTTNGVVNLSERQRTCSIHLASASLTLLKDVQLLLSNFGIVSRIDPRQSGAARAGYELVIDKANRDSFLDKIGFISNEKQQKATAFSATKARRSNRETFVTTLESVEPAGTADVYDFSEPATNSLIANGLVAHNCGEQWLGPFENCCLGSVNLAQHFGADGTVDWEKLRESVVLSTIFLDDVVEANAYVPAVPQLKEAALRARRIGLGIMGLADLMYHAGIRYGAPEGQEFAAQVMEFVRYHSMRTSVELAQARGAFPALPGSIYDPENFQWQPPASIVPYEHHWNRPRVDWDEIEHGIRQHGIRNAAQTTIAPTGTIATVAGCEGYGCEPVFALAYIRHVNDNGKDLKLTYASPLFEKAMAKLNLTAQQREAVLDQIMREGSCQGVDDLPAAVRQVFAVSSDITAEEHVRMQAALQAFVDNSLSKTVNFPAGASEADVATAYQLAWSLGCKGITVYVTGSREKVVLETYATAEKKQAPAGAAADNGKNPEQLQIWHEAKKPRPRSLPGYTYSIQTPLGKAFVTVNENGSSQPFEVFIITSKAGSDTAAVSDAIGRLVSYILRLASPVAPVKRLNEIVRQLSGIGGGRPLGFGPNRVRSLPDGVAQVLNDYLEGWAMREEAENDDRANGKAVKDESDYSMEARPHVEQPSLLKIGDLCPECGQAAVVNEEGCRKCYSCGYSEC